MPFPLPCEIGWVQIGISSRKRNEPGSGKTSKLVEGKYLPWRWELQHSHIEVFSVSILWALGLPLYLISYM